MAVTKRPGRKARQAGANGQPSIQKATFDATRKKEVGVSDLTLLSTISEKAILENTKQRFHNGLIYTYIGHVLISINPFQDLGIYTQDILESYQGKNRLEVPPHVFAIAESMYYNMKSYNENQCVIISGESGAGKTEAAKRIMQYVASVSGQSTSAIQQIKDMVLATNPLLESFGCAKTLRNDNSSRHGKYLEMMFNEQSEPVGAHITNYLLEKNRVVGQLKNERNFHIFYQYTKGAPQRYREMFGVQKPEVYRYTFNSQCTSINGVNDENDFNETLKVMSVIGLSQEEQDNIFKLLAAILWIGNITFNENDSDSSTSVADSSVTNFAAYLLDVVPDTLERALTTKVVEAGIGQREVFESPLNRVQANAVRDALAKAIYNNLFEWIVSRVNESLTTQQKAAKSIGILDIYGFEIFDSNSFEQLCINYVNEKLQQIFIQLTLKTEQDEYIAEQIKWTPIDYFNNKIVCDLIEETRPPGLFSVLNDACATAHADAEGADQSFAMKLNMLSSNPHLQLRSHKFLVKHYAGDVTYEVESMTNKNKDQLGKSLTRLIASSSGQFLTSIFPDAFETEDSASGKRKRRATASDKIKRSANDLMTTLSNARPSYIRTIKPNPNRSPTEFVEEAVLHQIKYLGLQENVRIRRAGFASRQPFDKFVERFYLLSSATGYAGDYIWKGSVKDATTEILRAANIPTTEYQMGVTKVFIKNPETLFALEHMKDMYWHRMASRIQRAWRKHFKRRMDAILVLQHVCKSYMGITNEPATPPPQDQFYHHQKERRRFSLLGERAAYGDYLVCNDKSSAGGYLVSTLGITDHVVFSSRGEQLFSKLGRSSQRLTRTFVLTASTFYTIRGDIYGGRLIYAIEREVPLKAIVHVAVSVFRDDWLAICTSDRSTSDLFLWTLLKTELVASLNKPVKVARVIEYAKKPGKMTAITFDRDAAGGPYDVYKSGLVTVGPGVSGNSPREEVPKRKKPSSSVHRAPRAHATPVHNQAPTPAHHPTPATPAQQPNPQPASHSRSQHRPTRESTLASPAAPPPPPPPPPPSEPSKPSAKALYEFPGTSPNELSLTVGQIVQVEQEDSGGGWTLAKSSAGATGWVPTAYIEMQSSNSGGANGLASGLAQALNNQQREGHALANDLAAAMKRL